MTALNLADESEGSADFLESYILVVRDGVLHAVEVDVRDAFLMKMVDGVIENSRTDKPTPRPGKDDEFPQKSVYFFVLKSSDGVIRAAFDSCDVCFRERKGYRQEGDLMICNNCGQAVPSVRINIEKGGCNPAPLERSTVGSNVVLKVPDICRGVGYV